MENDELVSTFSSRSLIFLSTISTRLDIFDSRLFVSFRVFARDDMSLEVSMDDPGGVAFVMCCIGLLLPLSGVVKTFSVSNSSSESSPKETYHKKIVFTGFQGFLHIIIFLLEENNVASWGLVSPELILIWEFPPKIKWELRRKSTNFKFLDRNE